MKTYKPGSSIYFSWDDGSREWGRVVDLYVDDEGAPSAYEVIRDSDGTQIRIDADRVIDLERVSADAGAALERIHAEAQRRADLLYELLGRLGFWASYEAQIRYRSGGKWVSTEVSDLLSEFRTRANNAAPLATAPKTSGGCGDLGRTRTH